MRRISLPYENKITILIFFTIGFVFFDRFSIIFLFPFLRSDLQLSNTAIGLVMSTLSLTWAASGYLVSMYADRKGKRKAVLVISIIVFSIASISSGLVTTLPALLVARALMGVAEGPVVPVGQTVMLLESTPSRRGFNMGVVQGSACGLLGLVLTPMLVIPVATHFGWRAAFFFAGAPGLVLAAFLCVAMREPKSESRSDSPVSIGAATSSTATEHLSFFSTIANRNIALCLVASCLFLTWINSILTFAPLYLIEARHMTANAMGTLMTTLGIASVLSGFLVPALSDRYGRRPILFIACSIGIIAPLALVFFHGSLLSFCAVIFVSFAAYGCLPLLLATIPAESVSIRYAGRTIALVGGVSEVIGGFLPPLSAGWAADRFGATTPFLISAAAMGIVVLCSVFLRETAPRIAGGQTVRSKLGASA